MACTWWRSFFQDQFSHRPILVSWNYNIQHSLYICYAKYIKEEKSFNPLWPHSSPIMIWTKRNLCYLRMISQKVQHSWLLKWKIEAFFDILRTRIKKTLHPPGGLLILHVFLWKKFTSVDDVNKLQSTLP